MTSLQQNVDNMLKRSLALHGTTLDADGNPTSIDKVNKEFLRQLASLTPDPEEQKKIIIEAWEDKTGTKMRALNAIRLEQVGNYIAAQSTIGSAFFETVTLKDNEEPHFENDSKNEVKIGSLGEDGKPAQVRVTKPFGRAAVGLAQITSPLVRYKTKDILRGDVSEIAKKTFDIAHDLTFQYDRRLFTLFNSAASAGGCFGSFSYENGRTNKANRVYLPHSGIVTAHLPASNDFDLTAAANTGGTNDSPIGGLTAFGIGVLRAVLWYGDAWGNVFPEGRLVPTGEVIVPASDIFSIATDAAPTSDTPQNKIEEDINTNGYTSFNYLGRRWKFIADITIAKGTCYPRFNLLPGVAFRKPSMDQEITNTNLIEHWEERQQALVYGAYIVTQRRWRAARLKYA
jgi:hypothetical protein